MHFAGHIFEPLASGALFWRAENALLVADLHLEKMSSFARSGQLFPPYDTGLTLKRLSRDLATTGATTLIALGDSFHRDYGPQTLSDADRATIATLCARAEWFWLSGNHDPAPHALGGQCMAQLERGGLVLTHEPRRGTPGLMAGHLHPSAHIHINGRAIRRPCFVHDGQLLILPAYGSSTGNLNILDPAFANLFDFSSLAITMLGRDRLYPVSPKRLIA
ncbi:ligase-associated DNA damage response endonuclease PdeM [Devosia rhodophyticola]|uniref:Ligase-associated DNA damage response endonuclease PdeM n=1 Tax=Devosia rhodophyticola TaxID=3026423 RepID=A0ABY7Z0T2_9HYPH|nr:ligase-associated DNA damage response endonuclease PdeM [Devosia rhodophyticola]WDR07069.1 ligase-associated DNA damage response endonuclease PdeM [Devosia rhodophyticola]